MDKILQYYKDHNISPQGETYLCIGDTYSIKDELKDLGCSYDKLLGWHSAVDLPSFSCIKINVNDYLVWDNGLDRFVPKSGAETAIKNLIQPPKPIQGRYFEGSRIEQQLVKVIVRSSFTGKYGLQYRYVMINIDSDTGEEGEYTFVYFTKTNIACQEGDVLYITSAQIKGHQEFNGHRQTVITRMKYETQEG